VQSSHYVLACYRYIESNPVRAGIALRPRDYEWSSYRQNAEGAGDPPVTPHAELQALGLGDRERRRAYASLFETAQPSALVDELRAAISGGYVLGDDSFERTVAGLLGRRVIKGLPGRPLGGAGNRSQPSLLEE
jgi:putative transposase